MEVFFYLGDYYKKGSKLAGNYLNKETESNYATNAYHEKTYEKYGNVQISAEPLYWKTASQENFRMKCKSQIKMGIM